MWGSGRAETDISRRLQLTRGAFVKLKIVWHLTACHCKTKLDIFKSNVVVVPLYGKETWKMTENDAYQLDKFQRLLKENSLNHLARKDYKEKSFQESWVMPISDVVTDGHWRWLDNVLMNLTMLSPRRGDPRHMWGIFPTLRNLTKNLGPRVGTLAFSAWRRGTKSHWVPMLISIS